MNRINSVAQYFLSKESMSCKKLQKLVQYAYSWTLAMLNDSVENIEYRLFPNRIEAWVHARKGIPAGITSSNLIEDIDIYLFFRKRGK